MALLAFQGDRGVTHSEENKVRYEVVYVDLEKDSLLNLENFPKRSGLEVKSKRVIG